MSGVQSAQQTAVIAYSARYNSGGPFQEPCTVFIKEFLPIAMDVACNELQTVTQLINALPSRKWHAAMAPASPDLPIVPLLGRPLLSAKILFI